MGFEKKNIRLLNILLKSIFINIKIDQYFVQCSVHPLEQSSNGLLVCLFILCETYKLEEETEKKWIARVKLVTKKTECKRVQEKRKRDRVINSESEKRVKNKGRDS